MIGLKLSQDRIPNVDDAGGVLLVLLLSILQLLANLLHVGHSRKLIQGNAVVLGVVLVIAALETSKQGSSLVILLSLGLTVCLVGKSNFLLFNRSLGAGLGLGLRDL
jgi:hypothetical protein